MTNRFMSKNEVINLVEECKCGLALKPHKIKIGYDSIQDRVGLRKIFVCKNCGRVIWVDEPQN